MARLTGAPDRLARVTALTALVCAALLPLGGCLGGGATRRVPPPQAALTPPAAVPQAGPSPSAQAPGGSGPVTPMASGGPRIGAGSVKVALVLPLTGPGANVGTAMRNAAQLAFDEAQQPDLTILVEDDRGTPDGARDAAQEALRQGAEIVLGPLFAGSVQSAAAVAKASGKPVIGFSTDVTVAAPNVYLLSFLPQPEVDRVVEESVAGGKRSFAALIPETAYGNAVEAAFRETVARRGARVAAVERYPTDNPGPAVERLARVITGPGATADALFIPETAEAMPTVAAALSKAGFSPARVRPIGTALWNEPALFALPALQGGHFAAPDRSGFSAFSGRYQARFGAVPPRVTSLAYDAVTLAAALARQYGSQRFAEATLTNGAGFAGVDGTFRFRPDGQSERALAVYEIRNNAATPVSPAPRVLAKPGI
ncbi:MULTISPECIES: penicillin-binding protein activator [unclassified Methylobacterium]|jgi:ABC-type branched-subunit amino acid transport system substrate-binding protein|uniref:penicillin-binding protein activator n=1 Tax=unclassified Methylobacterium TaxID=2615210 RepID=UPI00192057C2|nr:penicillin-binding protein activator [Methylobacterium sp. 2A]